MEKISALMDGDLDERQLQRELGRLRQAGELREAWNTFHLIGDALRGERLLLTDVAGSFSRRLMEEPAVLAPQRTQTRTRRMTAVALSAAASVAAAVFVGWVALSTPQVRDDYAAAQAQVVAPAPVTATPVVPVALPDNGSRNEYILAHQGFSPSTAMQGVAPYIRSVSARHPAADR